MKVVLLGSHWSKQSLKRLLLVADQIVFVDVTGGSLVNWNDGNEPGYGSAGFALAPGTPPSAEEIVPSELHALLREDSPIALTTYCLREAANPQLLQSYFEADVVNGKFLSALLQSLLVDEPFAARSVHADMLPAIRDAIKAHNLVEPKLRWFFERFARRVEVSTLNALRECIARVSLETSAALVAAAETHANPIAADPTTASLLALKTSDASYIGQNAGYAALLGCEVARAVIPDEALGYLSFDDLLEYRARSKATYDAWAVELAILAQGLEDIALVNVPQEVPRLLATTINPRIAEYRRELKATSDKLFGDITKTIATWYLPSLSIAYLADLSIGHAVGAFVAASGRLVPAVVDYWQERRSTRRKSSVAYLLGIVDKRGRSASSSDEGERVSIGGWSGLWVTLSKLYVPDLPDADSRLKSSVQLSSNGRQQEAIAEAAMALSLYSDARHHVGVAKALVQIARIQSTTSPADARKAFEDARRISAEVDYWAGEAASMEGLGDLELHDGNLDTGRQFFQRALSLYDKAKDEHGKGNVLISIGQLEMREGHHTAAEDAYRRAEVAYAQDSHGRANALILQAQLHLTLDNADAAAVVCRQAAALYAEAGDRLGAANSSMLEGVAMAAREPARCRELLLGAAYAFREMRMDQSADQCDLLIRQLIPE